MLLNTGKEFKIEHYQLSLALSSPLVDSFAKAIASMQQRQGNNQARLSSSAKTTANAAVTSSLRRPSNFGGIRAWPSIAT